MNTSLVPVPPERLAGDWKYVSAHIEKMATATRGKLTADDFAAFIARGVFQLWVVEDEDGNVLATVVTEIVAFPKRRVGRVVGCVGDNKASWVHLLGEIEDWARSQGCAAMEIVARKGWARVLPDYDFTHVFLERDL